jgi:hypothetical protein
MERGLLVRVCRLSSRVLVNGFASAVAATTSTAAMAWHRQSIMGGWLRGNLATSEFF